MNSLLRPNWLIFALLSCLLIAGCKSELYNDLSQQEANEMSAILSQRGISTSRERGAEGRYTLSVEDKHFSQSVEILSRLGYPKEAYKSFDDIFSGNKLVTSPLEERSRLAHALSQELSQTLTSIDGILRARVHVVLPEVTPLGKPLGVPTASVTITHAEDVDIQRLFPSIKNIVASSVKGLDREDVSVSLHQAQAFGLPDTAKLSSMSARNEFRPGGLSAIFALLAVLFLCSVALSQTLRGQKRQQKVLAQSSLHDRRELS